MDILGAKEVFNMSIGSQLTGLRNKKGLSRVQLAKELNIPMTTLRNYEQDEREPGHKFLIEAARYFDVTTDYILENEKAPAPEGTEDEEQAIDELEEELRSVLLKHGLLHGGDITPEQNAFLKHVFALILAYFQKTI